MTVEEIKEKYGIEPIMKEMWVWDDDKEYAIKAFVMHKKLHETLYPYYGIDHEKDYSTFKNASETNPNYKEPKVGDKGYFWENEGFYLFGELLNIKDGYYVPKEVILSTFKHFSNKKQPWMK